MSDDFDIKTALVVGMGSQIDAAVRPAHRCETFNASILTMAAGTYRSTCGIGLAKTIKQTRITGTGMVLQDKTSADLTKMETILSLSYSRGSTNAGTSFVYAGPLNPPFGAGIWGINPVFESPVSVGPTLPWFCSVDDDTPPTRLEKDVNISQTMMVPVQGLYRMLPVHSCTYNRTIKNDKPIEFSIDGSTVRLGDRKWNLSMETEVVTLLGIDPRLAQGEVFKNDEPGFQFHGSDESDHYSFYYARNKEILWFSAVETNESITFCDFDLRGQDL